LNFIYLQAIKKYIENTTISHIPCILLADSLQVFSNKKIVDLWPFPSSLSCEGSPDSVAHFLGLQEFGGIFVVCFWRQIWIPKDPITEPQMMSKGCIITSKTKGI